MGLLMLPVPRPLVCAVSLWRLIPDTDPQAGVVTDGLKLAWWEQPSRAAPAGEGA